MLALQTSSISMCDIMSCVWELCSPLRNLVYVNFHEELGDIAQNIYLIPSLHTLMIPLLEHEDMWAIYSHPSILNLVLIIQDDLLKQQDSVMFNHPLQLFSLTFHNSFLFPGMSEQSLNAALTLFRTPLQTDILSSLYPAQLTHIDFGYFNMCSLGDTDLKAISLAMPQIETLILSTSHYWPSIASALLAGVSSLLLNCHFWNVSILCLAVV